ncbi:MAG: hypothetical protein U1A78_09550 [Polyangia bacterium]
MSRRGAVALAAAVRLGLAGCEPPPPPPGQLSLGTIDTQGRWVDLADVSGDAEVELVPGAQGGFHVWLKYRISGLSGRVRVSRIAERIGPGGTRQRVLTAPSTVLELPADGSRWETPDPIPSFMCPTPIGVSVLDAPVEFLVTMEAADATDQPPATLARAAVTLRPRCPPEGDGTRPFCLQICKG